MKQPHQTPVIITIMGTVGAGKTTQIKLLKKYLEQRGEKTVQTYLRSTHGTTYLLSKFFRLLNTISDNKIITTPEFRKRTQSIWNISESISITAKFLISVYLPYKLGYNVIIEEGLVMTRAHFTKFRPYLTGIPPTLPSFVVLLERWLDKPNHYTIIIDAQDQTLDTRRKSRTFRKSESSKFIELQRQSFKTVCTKNMIIIDTTTKTIQDVHKTIINHLKKTNNQYY